LWLRLHIVFVPQGELWSKVSTESDGTISSATKLITVPLSQPSIAGEVVRTRRLINVPDCYNDARFYQGVDDKVSALAFYINFVLLCILSALGDSSTCPTGTTTHAPTKAWTTMCALLVHRFLVVTLLQGCSAQQPCVTNEAVGATPTRHYVTRCGSIARCWLPTLRVHSAVATAATTAPQFKLRTRNMLAVPVLTSDGRVIGVIEMMVSVSHTRLEGWASDSTAASSIFQCSPAQRVFREVLGWIGC
jgi:hypothetical protein